MTSNGAALLVTVRTSGLCSVCRAQRIRAFSSTSGFQESGRTRTVRVEAANHGQPKTAGHCRCSLLCKLIRRPNGFGALQHFWFHSDPTGLSRFAMQFRTNCSYFAVPSGKARVHADRSMPARPVRRCDSCMLTETLGHVGKVARCTTSRKGREPRSAFHDGTSHAPVAAHKARRRYFD